MNKKRLRAIFLATIMLTSMIGIGATGVASQSVGDGTELAGSIDTEVEGAGVSVDASEQDVRIADEVRESSGKTTLLLTVDRNIDRSSFAAADVNAEQLQEDSAATLQPVADSLSERAGAEVRQQFWVGNIVSVTVDLDQVSVDELAKIEGVTGVAPNVEMQHPSPVNADSTTEPEEVNEEFTYGLEQIDVPGFDAEYGATGDNTTVSIIDDGVSDPENIHPDLDIDTRAIAEDGDVTEGTLGEPGSHGEHVAGTATAAADPVGDVPRYGVAPDADLIKINSFEGGAAAEDTVAAVQYSAEEGADVASMSLGFPPQSENSVLELAMANQIQDANAMGTLVIGSAGNEGVGDAGGPATSPGAEFHGFSIGASNESGSIADFSSGAVIDPFSVDYVGSDTEYPPEYPREYVKPDVAAPGVDVLSAGPLGGDIGDEAATYSFSSGTSMAAPHAAGAVALIQSATEDELSPKTIEMALAETAEKPDNEFEERHNRDIRFGAGIINVTAATQAIEDGTLEIEGTVTDSDDEPIVGATVETAGGALTTTNQSGEYTLQTTTEPADVTADAFGFGPASETVETDDEAIDFQLDEELAVEIIEDQPAFVEFGGEFDITVDVQNLDELTVTLTEETDVNEENATLLLNGDEISFGETQEFDELTGEATLTVDLAENATVAENDEIGLEHTFVGPGDEITVTTGPTELTESLDPAFFELDGLSAPEEVILGDPIPASVEVTNTGQQTDTKFIQFFADDGDTLISLPEDSLTLDPGETETYEVQAAGVEAFYSAGEVIEHGFFTADDFDVEGNPVEIDDEVSADLALQAEGAFFEVADLTAPVEADPGEEITVSATINSIGEDADEQDVTFQFDGETLGSESVNLDAFELNEGGTSTDVEFTAEAPGESGYYTHSISTANDSETAILGVGEPVTTATVVGTDAIYGPQTLDLIERGLDENSEPIGDSEPIAADYTGEEHVDSDVIADTDVFVFHDLEDRAEELITAVEDDPTTTAVYLEQFAGADAIAERSEVTGDPELSLAAFDIDSNNPVEFEVVADHPLFDGIAEDGERFVTHQTEDADRAFFEGASGETLAEVGTQGESDGPAAAVDPETGSVLLGTIAPNTFQEESAFTDDAAQVLANAVSVAEDGVITDAVAQTTIDAEFIGTVNDEEEITVEAIDVVEDEELVDGEEITFTVGEEEVGTATVEDGDAELSFDPATISADAGETLEVTVEEYAVIDPATVETVHETLALQEGFNLLSIPQSAELTEEGVDTVNRWDAESGTYENVTDNQFTSPEELSQGVYVSAESDDARLGMTFENEVPMPGTDTLSEGWNLLGSNFAIDSTEDQDNRTLEDDLIGIDDVDDLVVFDAEFTTQLDADDEIGAFDAYWVYTDEELERATESPPYNPADREQVLG